MRRSLSLSMFAICLTIVLVMGSIVYCDARGDIAAAASVSGQQTLPGDKINCFSPPGLNGTVLYTWSDAAAPPIYYLVLHHIGLPVSTPNVLSYQLNLHPFMVIAQLKFSPDGQAIAFKDGSLGQDEAFALSILDLKTGKLVSIDKPIPAMINATFVAWSPNSRYLAYQYGDFMYAEDHYEPSQLWIFDRVSGQSHMVVRHARLTDIAWTAKNRLLYSLSPAQQRRPDGYFVQPKGCTRVYQVDPLGNWQPSLLLPDGKSPTPSPDGHWIAAFHWRQHRYYLTMFPLHGGKPVYLRPLQQIDGNTLLWSADSRHLYRVSVTEKSERETVVSFFDTLVTMRTERAITAVRYHATGGYVTTRGFIGYRSITPLAVSGDEHYLVYSLEKVSNEGENGHLAWHEYLYALDLAKRKVVPVCQVAGYGGIDWHDESMLRQPR
ncbi:MAG TPA: hypothetical protein VHV83_03150 [Armatimonadota bacterium]|nr:hypothetical protein [Armatimonadota bacterium]